MRIYPQVNAKYRRNLDFASIRANGFIHHMVENIPKNCQFRIHVSGDFFSTYYIERWREVAARRPDVIFYAYTRSWRSKALWAEIRKLAKLPNVNINLSVDDETGKPSCKNAHLFRWCYLTKTDQAPRWIRKGDIVFRSNHVGHKRRRKNAAARGENPDVVAPLVHRLGGVVCPMERGKPAPSGFSCKTCGLCVNKLEAKGSI